MPSPLKSNLGKVITSLSLASVCWWLIHEYNRAMRHFRHHLSPNGASEYGEWKCNMSLCYHKTAFYNSNWHLWVCNAFTICSKVGWSLASLCIFFLDSYFYPNSIILFLTWRDLSILAVSQWCENPAEFSIVHRNFEHIQTSYNFLSAGLGEHNSFPIFSFVFLPWRRNKLMLYHVSQNISCPYAIHPENFPSSNQDLPFELPKLVESSLGDSKTCMWWQLRRNFLSFTCLFGEWEQLSHNNRVCILSLRKEILQLCHASWPAGHFEIIKMIHLLLIFAILESKTILFNVEVIVCSLGNI